MKSVSNLSWSANHGKPETTICFHKVMA